MVIKCWHLSTLSEGVLPSISLHAKGPQWAWRCPSLSPGAGCRPACLLPALLLLWVASCLLQKLILDAGCQKKNWVLGGNGHLSRWKLESFWQGALTFLHDKLAPRFVGICTIGSGWSLAVHCPYCSLLSPNILLMSTHVFLYSMWSPSSHCSFPFT